MYFSKKNDTRDLYFGETDEERYENIKALNKFAKKVSRIFAIVGTVAVTFMLCSFTFGSTDEIGTSLLILAIMVPSMYVGFRASGKDYAWAWVWYRSTHNTENLGSDLANIATKELSVSYFIGGRGMAKGSIFGMLAFALGALTYGIKKGARCRRKYEKTEKILAKKLGKI